MHRSLRLVAITAGLCGLLWFGAALSAVADDKPRRAVENQPAPAEGYRVYRWTNPAGEVEFSDDPRPGATEVIVKEPMTVPAKTGSLGKAAKKPQNVPKYTKLAIRAPAQDEVIWLEPDASVSVAVTLEPGLHATHLVRLKLDGADYGKPLRATQFDLVNLDRGTHQVQVAIVDQTNKVVTESTAVTFHVKRHAAGANPAAGSKKP